MSDRGVTHLLSRPARLIGLTFLVVLLCLEILIVDATRDARASVDVLQRQQVTVGAFSDVSRELTRTSVAVLLTESLQHPDVELRLAVLARQLDLSRARARNESSDRAFRDDAAAVVAAVDPVFEHVEENPADWRGALVRIEDAQGAAFAAASRQGTAVVGSLQAEAAASARRQDLLALASGLALVLGALFSVLAWRGISAVVSDRDEPR